MNKKQLLPYVVGAIICPSTLLSCADGDQHDEPVWTAGTVEILYSVPGDAIKKSIIIHLQAGSSASTTISMLI